jgi:hypothetical protein
MASQRPGRDIPRLDYHSIVKVPRLDNESLPTKPAHPLVDLLIDPPTASSLTAIDAVDDPASTTAVDATNKPPTLDNDSNIYDNSEDDTPITPATSIQPSESVSQASRVPRRQARLGPWSLVYNHFVITLLDDYFISKRTKKRTQDRQLKCKYC